MYDSACTMGEWSTVRRVNIKDVQMKCFRKKCKVSLKDKIRNETYWAGTTLQEYQTLSARGD